MTITINDLFNLTLKIENFGGWLKTLQYYLKDRTLFTAPKRNEELLEKPRRRKCYIIGLGPSLRGVNPDKLDGDSVVVNRFYKVGKEWPNFIPTYYLIADKAFINPQFIDDFKEVLNIYMGKGTKYVLNSSYVNAEILKDFPQEQLYYISAFKGSFKSYKKIKINNVMPSFGNVVCNAIAWAMGIGYKEIILLGCDFNSFASRISEHCYNEPSKRQIRLDYELFHYAGNANMHMQLQGYAVKHGISIINSTIGSLIDAYPYEIVENLYH